MRDHLLIYVNGTRHEIAGAMAFRPLAEFLRCDLGLTGTKVVCAEGDCGSCSVLIGRAQDATLRYSAICSCIQFPFQLDCTHVITVEGLSHDGALNPVQEAMVRCQGSQCGYCTPGMIVALQSMFENRDAVEEADVHRALVGNLCRCTGYEPIVRAGIEADAGLLRRANTLYPPQMILADFQSLAGVPVHLKDADRELYRPTSIESAVQFKAENPDYLIVAGATDLGVQVNKGLRRFGKVMTLDALAELREIQCLDGMMAVGGCASIADLERASVEALPEYARIFKWFGSPPIKAAATLGGNIVNASPIGDTMPALLALNATVELTGPGGSRRININDFYTGYRATAMRSDEILTRVLIPLPESQGQIFKLYKVSRRKELDISAFTAAIWLRVETETIREARVVYGGVAPVILRLPRTEQSLMDAPLCLETFERAGQIARTEVKPISDVRGSMEYRLQLAENILLKCWYEIEEDREAALAPVSGLEEP